MNGGIDKKRMQIDGIDRKVTELIARRARLAREIGACKRRLGVGLSDAAREKEVLGRMKKNAELLGIEPEFMAGIGKRIISYCKKEQKK